MCWKHLFKTRVDIGRSRLAKIRIKCHGSALWLHMNTAKFLLERNCPKVMLTTLSRLCIDVDDLWQGICSWMSALEWSKTILRYILSWWREVKSFEAAWTFTILCNLIHAIRDLLYYFTIIVMTWTVFFNHKSNKIEGNGAVTLLEVKVVAKRVYGRRRTFSEGDTTKTLWVIQGKEPAGKSSPTKLREQCNNTVSNPEYGDSGERQTYTTVGKRNKIVTDLKYGDSGGQDNWNSTYMVRVIFNQGRSGWAA